MNKQQIEETFRWRKTLIKNYDKIIGAYKSSAKINESNKGQFSLFSIGMEDCKVTPKLEEHEGYIDIMQSVNEEAELIGVPIFYNPLDDCDMYKHLFATHEVYDLLDFDKDKSKIIVLDRIVKITSHKSKKSGSSYAKIYTSMLGVDEYWFLFGRAYSDLISKAYVNEIYLFELNYRIPTANYSKSSVNISYLKNIKDVDINSEYNRLVNLPTEGPINREWIEKNHPEWI